MVIHLESDILECEVKWALESIATNKASGGDGIPVELFQILKDDAVKSAALNMPANLENSAVATGLQKVSFHSNPNDKECSNYHTIALISHASRVFSNESALHIRWPKYWSFNFNISPSNEHLGLIFFGTACLWDWNEN